MFNKVLILSASAGNGHVRAGQALERAFKEVNAAQEVRHIDALDYSSPVMRNLYSKTYIDMVNKAPTVLGWLYDAADIPWRAERRRLAFDRLNALPLVRYINDYKPELIVSTHFMPAEIVSWLLCKNKIQTHQAVVVTDFDAHAMWLCRHCDQYFTAMEETRQHLERLGVPKGDISVTGIPIDPVFAMPKSKSEMRAKYQLSPDKTIIMLSAGGFGVGPIDELLHQMLGIKHPVQILAMCGRNEKMRIQVEELNSRLSKTSPVDIKAIGYTAQMDEYMSAADIIVGKPGGLTTSEALAKQLVFVVVNPIPGQEERNSDHLLEEGAAIRCNNLPTLAYKIDKLLDDPTRIAAIRNNAALLGRPNSSKDVVARLLEIKDNGWAHEAVIPELEVEHVCLSPIERLWATRGRLLQQKNNRLKAIGDDV
jgi:processive 1,2-diacylglycerol beta-glucosyltransferase